MHGGTIAVPWLQLSCSLGSAAANLRDQEVLAGSWEQIFPVG